MSFFDSDEEEEVNMSPSKAQNNQVVRIGSPIHFLNNCSAQPFEDMLTKTTRILNGHFETLNSFQAKYEFATYDPLKPTLQVIDTNYEDHMGMFNLVQTPDPEFGKIIVVFSQLDNEVNKAVQKFESTMYDGLVSYGYRKEGAPDFIKDREATELGTSNGEKEMQISRMLGHFRDVFELIKRVSSIILNLVNQLHAIYFEKDRFFKNTFKNFQMFSVLATLSKACSLIYTVDLIMKENPSIRQDFARFRAQVKNMAKEPARYKVTENQLKKLERVLNKFEKTILSGQCLLGTISQSFDQKTEDKSPFTAPASAKPVKDNEELYNLFTDYMKMAIDQAEIISTSRETFERKQLFNDFCLYALYRKLFPKQEDRDIWKKLWHLQKVAPILVVQSHLVFDIADFLSNYTPLVKKSMSKDPKDAEAFIDEYLEKKDDTFEKEMAVLYDHFRAWATQMDSYFGGPASLADTRHFQKSCPYKLKLLIIGLINAVAIRSNILTLLFLHVKKGVPFTEGLVSSMMMGCMVLKGMKHILDENLEGMPPFFLMEENSISIKEKLNEAQGKIKKGTAKQEIYQSIELIKENLAGAASSQRFSIIFTCLNFLNPKKDKIFKEQDFGNFKYEIWRQKLLSQYQIVFREACDCSFLYWTKDLIPLFYGYVGDHPMEMKRLNFLNLAIQDCQPQLLSALHLEKKGALLEYFKEEVLDHLNKEVLRKICNEVDEHLRLLMHSMLIEKLKSKNPFETPTKPVHHYLENGPIELFGTIIDPIEHVSNYLDETFYNLNILNLHDYETYEGLRNLAEHLFGVDLLHPYLPSQSIEKGNVDVLNIMRGISGFVSKFNYNMYTQTFVESTKDSKILNTVGIQQIADSVQTHGAGILNTSANLVYTFILKKFNVFSQFLYDELVQSPLLRETKTFRENKEAWDGKYPYTRADSLMKEIKRLGVFEDGKTFLDKFRLLITTIGNSLGFVRLLRSASLSYCSKQIEYLPYKITFLEEGEMNENYYEELCKTGGFSGTTIGSANHLDDVIKTLKANFTERTDYLRLLVKNFDGMFGGQDYKHLRVFYIMVPALTLNYVEACIAAKEKVAKKMAPDSYIFVKDDGFALGAAYFLRLLGQDAKFDALHWFDELKRKFDADLKVIKETTAENLKKTKKERDEDEDFELNLQMSAKKINTQVEEFNYFKATFQTARILFREVAPEKS